MRWISLLLCTLIFYSKNNAQDLPGFRVTGRHLYDRCGEKVILRGIANPNIWFEENGIPRYGEIEKTGANVVRIVWQINGSAGDLDQAITNCRDMNMIPMVELHDATGDWGKLQDCVDYWIRTDVIEVLLEHEEYLLINIANECGNANVSKTSFRNGYENAINALRNAGIRVPLVIDGTDWGKDINILQSEGPYLINADPDHNLIFSVHMWWPQMYGYSESDIVDEIAESVNMNLPLIVGEFSQMHGECTDNTITSSNSIAYKTIIKECQENEVGYIAWSWFGNCNDFWDMSSEGTYSSLYDWGLEAAVTDPNSIANTSVRPYSIVNDGCDPAGIKNTSLKENSNITLHQDYPNPFHESTRIEY
ncbi:MAG: cellulase family glycosylhydrolase [Bacteroidales bacterium]|nr:cellulase family glycosylhydrolase [Bacteroidales bacterium]